MKLTQPHCVLGHDSTRARLPHDIKYRDGSAFIHGHYCPLPEAAIPITDGGFGGSDVVYEKVTVAKGRYFRLEDHFDRLASSCEKFRLHNPYTTEQMVKIFHRLIALTGLKDAGLFCCVTRGAAKWLNDRSNRHAYDNRFYATADSYASIATPEQRNDGLKLLISKKYIRIPPRAVDPTAKNFHWQDLKLSLFEARDAGMDWSVLSDLDGGLTESPGANIFVVKNGALYTPDRGCLLGITRKTALELAEEIGVRVYVERVLVRQLLDADEAFITSSAGGIMPVNSVDGIVLGGIAGPGELTRRLRNLYWEKMWDGWKCTPVDYDVSIK